MYRVLLADDEQIERMALARRLMRRFGDILQISEATNGKEAVQLYEKEHSQIIIMDISMPELNGVEAAEKIRSMDEDCIIVFLTAYDEFSYAKRAIVIRALDYLLKPCDEEELTAVMEEAMRLTDKAVENKKNSSGSGEEKTEAEKEAEKISAAMLGRELHKPARQLAAYERQAAALRKNIDRHFGGMVEGFDTYRYYTGNDRLRAWICIPLTVGIDERKEATVEALFSPKLWTENGLLTRSGDKTFWDRSTLYALRGVYASGETEKATGYLSYYSGVRLLGDHVPYAIEAWPEGSQRHLSAESGLYCRILTEGVFGIRPTGFRSFTLTPRLPAAWDRMNLRNVRAFGSAFDIEVRRAAKGMEVAVTQDGREVVRKRLRAGQSLGVTLE